MRLPLQFGGGPDAVDAAYDVLRSAVGIGGSATDDSGIDGLWRRARAVGLESGSSATRRAIYNGLPNLSTDMIPYYERVLGVIPGADSTQEDRRQEVGGLWPAKSSALLKDIESELRRIDSRFSIVRTPESTSTTSVEGRWFGPNDGATEAPTWSGASALAGPTTRYSLAVCLSVVDQGNPTQNDLRSVAYARRKLRAILPSHWNFSLTLTLGGFVLGVSRLGVTAMREMVELNG